MPDKPDITRRDFLNGVAMSVAAGASLSPLESLASPASIYPPSLTGLRGSHAGSFEAAHAIAWSGARFELPGELSDSPYDLIVVGGGLSGLSAALLYRQRAGEKSKILIIDNHDDFGGHAKRNEFTVSGVELIGYGGSQSIEAPAQYSAVARRLLSDVSIETSRFYQHFDQGFYRENGLENKLYFGAHAYARDALVEDVIPGYWGRSPVEDAEKKIESYPISADGRRHLLRLLTLREDLLPGMTGEQQRAYLQKISYTEFLHRYAQIPKEVSDVFRDRPRGIWGVGWDATSALEAHRWGYPGFDGLDIADGEARSSHVAEDEPYIFHFPDGNAGIARCIVRKLVPEAIAGTTMEDIVKARVDYDALDRAGNDVRIRLNSTAIDIRNVAGGTEAAYLRDGKVFRVSGKHLIYAGYHNLLPHICAELPQDQREAIQSVAKVPLVYLSIAVRDWTAFSRLGISGVQCAKPLLMHSFGLDFPVSMGGYRFAESPQQPTVLHGTYVPAVPDKGLDPVSQYRQGRRRLYEMSFQDFENKIRTQLDGALKEGGFDAERDIAAITVNRWPHGYAYEYNELWDDPSFGPQHGPHLVARKPLERISIANSDASAYAYVDGAIDAADRAVVEQLGT